MPVRADAPGFTQAVTQTVTPRWALAYAASLRFTAPACLDDAAPGGLAIPGPFCVCLEWALVGGDERAARLGLTAAERRRNVHVSQDSVFHRPVRPGMAVTTTSRIAHARQTSAGAFLLTRLDSRDAATGALLVTSWSGAVLRGVAFDGEVDAAMPSEAPAEPQPLAPGGEREVIATARGLPHVYSECARIWNPIHTERAVALAAGLPDIVLHGTITWALAGQAILRARAGGDVTRLRRLSARFRAPVIPGDSFTLHHAAAAEGVRFTALAKGGAVALASGLAVLG